MKNRVVVHCFVLLALLVTLGVTQGHTSLAAAPATPAGIQGPFVGEPVVPGVYNGDLRDLPQLTDNTPQPREIPLLPIPGRHQPAPLPDGLDPVAQTQPGTDEMPSPIISFSGLQGTDAGSWVPPDTNGDVGLTHYVQVVNIGIGMFDKATGTRLVLISYNDFFDGTGTLCDYSNRGDTTVIYDQMAGRWIISDFGWVGSSGPYYQCIAVSQSEDPVSGGWYFYALLANPSDPNALNDYPKLATWPDAYYMSANMFYGTVSGARVWALNRAAMLNGQPMTWVAFSLGSAYWSLLPSELRGPQPPAGSPNYFVALDDPHLLRLWKFHVDWVNPGNSTFTGPTNVNVASFTYPGDIPQPAPGEMVDSLGDRLMFSLQYRNFSTHESLWVNHTVASAGVTGVRWYELRDPAAPTLYQQGTYQPDSTYRWMGSLAVDKQGNMAVGYSVSSTTVKPSIRYAGRLVTDPLGTLPQGEASIIEGTGVQLSGSGRWGDYSKMTVDPVDDCTFWYTNEYYQVNSNRNWQTYIGSFKFPGCEPAGTLHLYRLKMNGRAAAPPYYKVVTSGIIHDGTNAPIVGVTVTGTYTYPDGSTEVKTTTTDSLGRFKVPVKKAQCGLYQFDVTSLSKAGYVDNPAGDHVSRHIQKSVACK